MQMEWNAKSLACEKWGKGGRKKTDEMDLQTELLSICIFHVHYDNVAQISWLHFQILTSLSASENFCCVITNQPKTIEVELRCLVLTEGFASGKLFLAPLGWAKDWGGKWEGEQYDQRESGENDWVRKRNKLSKSEMVGETDDRETKSNANEQPPGYGNVGTLVFSRPWFCVCVCIMRQVKRAAPELITQSR